MMIFVNASVTFDVESLALKSLVWDPTHSRRPGVFFVTTIGVAGSDVCGGGDAHDAVY